ncbi:hypothetical protein KSX_89740 [Ktedonospora formicarum]|uniref:Uncharacterized protein n=1 Tax=Ktedonospora formicarum TaxID=2778364 RepID=A0A8J3I8X6_9CHLR|nr:gamma-glutamyl-gamma-aminobutyrate hydrolase family protein [Ktedonospora formicarum]GHO50811.1 hypothetical protein KSX_89740 [Ktedonospora formicarum]
MRTFARDLFLSQNLMPGNTVSKIKQGVEQEHFSRAYQPIIGIPIPIQQTAQGPLMLADAVGAWAIERMGGRVFLIPLWPFPPHKHMYHSLWPLVQSMDGLLLPASTQGAHWSIHWHQRESRPGPQIWSLTWEMALMQLATFIGMPILAIADGAEKWNVALGGMIQEVPASVSPQNPLHLRTGNAI